MTALAQERATKRRTGARFVDPVAADAVLYLGGLAVLDASGDAVTATAATGLIARGVNLESIDNTGGLDGGQSISVESGVWLMDNDPTDPLDRSHINSNCYILDDQTVSALATGRSIAGLVKDIDGNGVWVQLG